MSGYPFRKLVFAMGALCLGGTSLQAQSPGESVRIGTYNSFLTSPLFKCFNLALPDCLVQVEGQTEEWANTLADTILADTSRYDIIVLNEVWDQDAKKILVRRLRSQYPVYVRELDASLVQLRAELIDGIPLINGVKFNGEDSGLMLFAKRGFQVAPLPDQSFKWGNTAGRQLKSTSPQVAFTLFEACGSTDCMAAKGAAMIRLRHRSERVYNIVFTHMQADYPDDNEFFPYIRSKQMRAIRKMVETTLAPIGSIDDVLKQERIFVAGDLNFAPLTTGAQEWTNVFNTSGSFWTAPIYDGWSRTTSPKDKGITNDVDNERLDYILTGPRPYESGPGGRMPVCVQHMTIPVDYRALESDHFMVHADTNLGIPHCHPQIAFNVDLSNPGLIDKDTGGFDFTFIRNAGNMQWFHVKTEGAGTYTIARLGQQAVAIDIYDAVDLTTPISRYNKVTTQVNFGERSAFVDQFVLPNDFYIRISGPNRNWTGDYALQVSRLSCKSKAESCLLQPGQSQSALLTGNGFGNALGQPQNEAWFRFDVTGQTDAGALQTIDVTGTGLPGSSNYTAAIADFANAGGGGALSQTAQAGGVSATGQAGDGATGYIVFKQAAPGVANVPVTALYDTSLRLLGIGNLICRDETNPELGSDDIYTRFTVDGTTNRYPASGDVSFDCDEPQHSRKWANVVGKDTITYANDVSIRVLELDDTSPNDPSREKAIPQLATNETKRSGKLVWNFEDGTYWFEYLVRKRPNQPVD